jgi:putative membrane protein
MLEISDLPLLNATLNALAGILLVSAYVMIRKGNVVRHRALMLAAFSMSVLFLVSYVIYHVNIGSRAFTSTGIIRVVYFVILATHVVLAIAVVPMAVVTLRRGLRRDDIGHKAIARWTFPIWLYVSVTGVVVYGMLYMLPT